MYLEHSIGFCINTRDLSYFIIIELLLNPLTLHGGSGGIIAQIQLKSPSPFDFKPLMTGHDGRGDLSNSESLQVSLKMMRVNKSTHSYIVSAKKQKTSSHQPIPFRKRLEHFSPLF